MPPFLFPSSSRPFSTTHFSTLLSRPPLPHILSLLTYIPLLLFANTHLLSLTPVQGISMYPLLNADKDSTSRRDWVLLDRWRPMGGVRRGMVVAFWSPTNPEVVAVKRVLALENDIVRTKAPYPFPTETVPQGHIWVEGEHPESDRWSNDSNHYGPISKSLLVGKVRALVFPVRRIGCVRWQDWKGSERVLEGRREEGDEL